MAVGRNPHGARARSPYSAAKRTDALIGVRLRVYRFARGVASAKNAPVIRLEAVTPENYEAALALEPAPDQATFVAPVVKSLADAYAYRESGARALVATEDGRAVGFVLLYPDVHHDEPVMCLVRLLVDKGEQGRGLGAAIMQLVIDEAQRAEPAPAKVKLSVVPTNDRAIRLYERFGFAGEEMEDGERVMLKSLAVSR